MQPIEQHPNRELDEIWEPNQEHVRRLLISLARDLDLAEDLVQETYLRARSGIAGYRGGDARAWLASIARNVFYAHVRRLSVRMEMPGDVDEAAQSSSRNGSVGHLDAIALRRALSELSPVLRTALILKHYGGFSYEEISERVGCPVGSARRRVWDAIRKLRASLGPMMEAAEMKCEQVRGARLIEFLYGGLSKKDAEVVEAHLENCRACKQEAQQLGALLSGLDSSTGDFRMTEICDLDDAGRATQYEWASYTNELGEEMESTWWTWGKDHVMEFAVARGAELQLEISPYSSSQYIVEAMLPHPVPPGGQLQTMFAARSLTGESALTQVSSDRWLFKHQRNANAAKEWVYVYAIRLPRGARLASATPEPAEIKKPTG